MSNDVSPALLLLDIVIALYCAGWSLRRLLRAKTWLYRVALALLVLGFDALAFWCITMLAGLQ